MRFSKTSQVLLRRQYAGKGGDDLPAGAGNDRNDGYSIARSIMPERCAGILYPLLVRAARHPRPFGYGHRLGRLLAGISYAGYNLRYGYGKLAGKRVARHFVVMPLQYMGQGFAAQVRAFAQQLFTVLYGQLPYKPLLQLLQPALGICQQEQGLQPLGFVEMDVGALCRCGNGIVHNKKF